MKGPYSALVILTRTLARASFSFFQFDVYIIVQTARPQVKRTKVSMCFSLRQSLQERNLGLFWGVGGVRGTADPWAKAENSRAIPIPGPMGAFSLQWSLLARFLGRLHAMPRPLFPAWGDPLLRW